MTCYVGIDNGVSGALALVDPSGGLLGRIAMPVFAARRGRSVAIVSVAGWLDDVVGEDPEVRFVIEQPGGTKSQKAAVSMANTYGQLIAMMRLRGVVPIEITPQSWQKGMLGKVPTGRTKEYALRVATELWPGEDWLATSRSRVPHDGLVDAALIAEFGRRNML